jgi:hypothetical protein
MGALGARLVTEDDPHRPARVDAGAMYCGDAARGGLDCGVCMLFAVERGDSIDVTSIDPARKMCLVGLATEASEIIRSDSEAITSLLPFIADAVSCDVTRKPFSRIPGFRYRPGGQRRLTSCHRPPQTIQIVAQSLAVNVDQLSRCASCMNPHKKLAMAVTNALCSITRCTTLHRS